MRRGDIWSVAGGKDYAGKARPVVILQNDSFDGTESITICAFTTDDTDAPLFRLPVEPNERNGSVRGNFQNGPGSLLVESHTCRHPDQVWIIGDVGSDDGNMRGAYLQDTGRVDILGMSRREARAGATRIAPTNRFLISRIVDLLAITVEPRVE